MKESRICLLYALVKCNHEISDNAKICHYINLKKDKRKKKITQTINTTYTIRDLQQRNILNFYKQHIKGVKIIKIIFLFIIIEIFTYTSIYNSKVDETKQILQGKWHDYTKSYTDESYLKWKIEINGNTLTDIFGTMHEIK